MFFFFFAVACLFALFLQAYFISLSSLKIRIVVMFRRSGRKKFPILVVGERALSSSCRKTVIKDIVHVDRRLLSSCSFRQCLPSPLWWGVARRSYTPIFTPSPPSKKFSDLQCAEEVRTLWASPGVASGGGGKNSSANAAAPSSLSTETPLFPISSVEDAVRWWIRFGNNPIVHTCLPSKSSHRSFASRSPFAYVEDYVGTNLIPPLESAASPNGLAHASSSSVSSPSPAQIAESVQYWRGYFEYRSAARLRQARRTAIHHVGVASSSSSSHGDHDGRSRATSSKGRGMTAGEGHPIPVAGEGAPTWVDEADQPHTRWDQDTVFKEWNYLAERHLKKKAKTLLPLEQYIWFPNAAADGAHGSGSCTAVTEEEAAAMASRFLSFLDATQEQRPPYLPLPIPSAWFYEGETRERWATRYLPAATESYHYFQHVLAPFVAKKDSVMDGQSALLQRLGSQLEKIHHVLIRRYHRQLTAYTERAEKTHTNAITDPSVIRSMALHQWCENELERFQRSIEEGELDPEDLLEEDAEAWKEEHQLLQALAEEPLYLSSAGGDETTAERGRSISFLDFWRHTVRREELETLHVLTDNGLRALGAAARATLLMEIPYEKVLSQLAASLREGTLDTRAAVFCPHFNSVWCKWHYAKFGGSSIAQHTHAAKRRLQFHYAASAEDVAATAALYYATKPMSSAVDYATPYTHRRSLTRLCGQYGVERMRAMQRPIITSAGYLAAAEEAIRVICIAAGVPFGKQRRAYDHNTRQIAIYGAQLLPPVTKVEIRDCVSELECTEQEVEEALRQQNMGITSSVIVRRSHEERNGAGSPSSIRWPLGGKKAVLFDWPHPATTALRLTREAGPYTADRVLLLDQLRRTGRIEVTLWRRTRGAESHSTKDTEGEEADEREGVASEQVNTKHTSPDDRIQTVEEVAAAWLASSPALREIYDYATKVCQRLHGTFLRVEDAQTYPLTPGHSPAASFSSSSSTAAPSVTLPQDQEGGDEVEEVHWKFVALLEDNLPLQEEGVAIVQLPFTATHWEGEADILPTEAILGEGGFGLPAGQYRLRVRCFDQRLHPGGLSTASSISTMGGSHAGLCSDGYSAPFEVYDAVMPVLEKYIKKDTKGAARKDGPSFLPTSPAFGRKEEERTKVAVFPGSALITICRALRKAGVEVPLQTEFEAGQVLTTENEVFADRFLSLLYESSRSRRKNTNTHWYHGSGAEPEDHLAITQYAPAGRLNKTREIIEKRAEAHWRLFHPGATAAEWASARYDVITRAMAGEREWWWNDRLLRDAAALSPEGMVPGLTDSADFISGAALHRYGVELCNLLTAIGHSYARDPPALLPYYRESYDGPLLLSAPPSSSSTVAGEDEKVGTTAVASSVPAPEVVSAYCRVNGRGEIDALRWHQVIGPAASASSFSSSSSTRSFFLTSPPSTNASHHAVEGGVPLSTLPTNETATTSSSLEEVLAFTHDALQAAQDRHATLTMAKLGPLEREVQVQSFCGVDGLEMGGKYARTYCYAVEKAKQAIEEEYGVAGRIIPGVREGEDKERVSDGMEVDRFASTTHPEQRLTRFVQRTTLSGQNLEDPTPDQESTWGR